MRKVQHSRNFSLYLEGEGARSWSWLWRSHHSSSIQDEGKVVGKLLGGLARLAGASHLMVVGEGMEQLLLTLTSHTQPTAKSRDLG